MINPYLDLGRSPEDVKGEEVEGTMECQERDCFTFATTGLYLHKDHLLTWICPEGHISKIEGFVL